ncbi:MAG: TIGR00730 family Rossman fold protein [Actinobacteria bacterium]|nr:TIGR00730 family Rossman fold protein [Actinomycetota bacterium]
MRRTVCVFCASSTEIDQRYLMLAAEVGAEIGRRGLSLVSGGGSVSSMGSLARAVRRAGGHTTGVIPEALLAYEVADTDADELIVTADMRERKGIMDSRADAFLVLPGGIGTLEEFFEVWVGRVLGMHDKPIVVLDPWDDFGHLHLLLDSLTERRFITADAASNVSWAGGVAEAFDAIAQGWARPAQGRRAPESAPDGLPAALVELESD